MADPRILRGSMTGSARSKKNTNDVEDGTRRFTTPDFGSTACNCQTIGNIPYVLCLPSNQRCSWTPGVIEYESLRQRVESKSEKKKTKKLRSNEKMEPKMGISTNANC